MKMMHKVKPTPAQIRAARGLLGWQQADLAKHCGISRTSIAHIENGHTQPSQTNLEKIMQVFWDAGLIFIEEEGLKRRSETIEILEGNEGIIRFFDNVYEHISAYGGEILVSGVDEQMFDEAQGETAEPHIKRMEALKNYTCKVIIRESDDNPSAVSYAEYRKVPDEMFSNVPFYLYGEKLAIILWGEVKHKVIVHSDRELTEAYRKQFYFVWQHGKTIPEKKIG